MRSPDVAIVVPVHNGAATLGACVRQLLATTVGAGVRVIVVDDGSTDGAVALLPADGRLHRIRRDQRRGVAAALNAGFAAAPDCDIVRVHADVVVETPGWLEALQAAAYRRARIAAVGSRLIYPDGRIESEGRSLVNGFGIGSRFYARNAFQDGEAAGKRAEVDTVSGAHAYYRREAIAAVGGLDEDYGPAWFEDDDFCFAARRQGFEIWVEPAVRAVHYTRAQGPSFRAFLGGTESVLGSLSQDLKQSAWRLQARHWESKWGWNPFYPDLGEIRRLYGDTPVTWQVGEVMRYRPSGETPPVDCCMVTWNSLPLLRRTVESLLATDYPLDRVHFYIANNGSTDGTAEYLAELAAKAPFAVTVLNLPVNTGVSVGLNLAISSGKGELVARLDDDIIVPAGWLRLLVGDLRARPFAGCAGLKTIGDDDRRAIQWGQERQFPRRHAHEEEPDGGQADFLGRSWYVAGCCCLYRRDVFQRCGLIDIRYSPTQWDDMDHGAAMTLAGYEVLCDGRLSVIHKKTSGLDRSFAGISSFEGGKRKLKGKWGSSLFESLDTAIVLSREGRCLPDDGDTGAWLALGPEPAAFPRRVAPSAADVEFIVKLYLGLNGSAAKGSPLEQLADSYLSYSRNAGDEGHIGDSMDAILTVLNFAPTYLPALRALAARHHASGRSAMGRAAAQRGLLLDPADRILRMLLPLNRETLAAREGRSRAAVASNRNRPLPAAREASGAPRVLLVGNFLPRPLADDVAYADELARRLRARGVPAQLRLAPQPDPRQAEVVHVFGSAQPHVTLAQVTAIRALAPKVPIVLTPFYGPEREASWCGRASLAVLAKRDPQAVEQGLAQLAAGRFELPGQPRPSRERVRIDSADPHPLQARLLSLVDQVAPFSAGEAALLREDFGPGLPTTVIPAAADAARAQASPDPFVSAHHLRDFILIPGPLDPIGNHLIVLHAVRELGLPVLMTGPAVDPGYVHNCRLRAPRGSLFLPNLDEAMLRSAYRAARLVVVPGRFDPAARDALAGALAGCSLALSRSLTDGSAYAGSAEFFEPGDLAGIGLAVQTALATHWTQAAVRRQLASRLAAQRDWPAIIASLLELYGRVRGEEAPGLEGICANPARFSTPSDHPCTLLA